MHAGFKNVIHITDRGYELMKNLEAYIARNQIVITSVKCGQGEALKAVKSIDLPTRVPEGMSFSKDTNLFNKHYILDYKVQGNGEHIIDADRLKLNVYFDIHKRADDLARVQMAITTQTEVVQVVYEAGKPVPKEDRETFRKEYIFKEQKLKSCERLVASLKPGITADLMNSIEDRLDDYAFVVGRCRVRRTSEAGLVLCEGGMARDEACA